MKLMKIGKHGLTGDFGWYPGNEFKLFGLTLFSKQADYPVGWMCWTLFEIQLGYLVIGLYLQNGRNL